MKYVSYLGLALTLSQGKSEEGLKLCEQAVKREFFDPDLYCNLGIVYLRQRMKAPAFEAFQKGLNLKPGHMRILDELEKYDHRSEPFFTFLRRDRARRTRPRPSGCSARRWRWIRIGPMPTPGSRVSRPICTDSDSTNRRSACRPPWTNPGGRWRWRLGTPGRRRCTLWRSPRP